MVDNPANAGKHQCFILLLIADSSQWIIVYDTKDTDVAVDVD
jgi:hypothetical protein